MKSFHELREQLDKNTGIENPLSGKGYPYNEMSAKAHYKKYQSKFRVPPIDKNRYPNKEKQGLEGPYRSKKSGKVFYYDKKAGKYYDTDSDMYLSVNDVMEDVNPEYDEDLSNMNIGEAMSSDKLLGIFNKLKPKDTVEIKFDSGIRKGKDYQKFVVTSGKRTVGKARVERIILKSVDNLRGVAYTLYNRKGNVTLAQGDMGVSIVDIKESVELDEAKSSVKSLGKEAKSVLAMAINMTTKGGPEAHPNNLDYFTPKAINAAIKFLDKNSKKLTPAGRHAAREIVKTMKESVELEEKVVKGEVAPFVVKQRDGNYVTQTQGKKIKYVGRELSKAQRFTKKDAEYFASRDRGSKVIKLDESVEQIDEKYLLASEDLAAVRKQAKQLANKFPTMRFYVIHNKKHVGFGERYEIVTNVNFHMYRNMPIQGQYDGKKFMNESVELDEADNTAAVAKQVKQAVKKYVTGTPRVQSKGGKVRFIMLRADKIDNKLRKMILDIEHPNAKVKNMDDIHYANISDRIISAGADVWMDALGLKEGSLGYKKALRSRKKNPDKEKKMDLRRWSAEKKKRNQEVHKEDIANTAGSGAVAGLGDEPPVSKAAQKKKQRSGGATGGVPAPKKGDLIPPALGESTCETFAGCRVFEVGDEEYGKALYGRQKYERWNKKFDMSNETNQMIRAYANRNPGKGIVVKNKKTGDMSYLMNRNY